MLHTTLPFPHFSPSPLLSLPRSGTTKNSPFPRKNRRRKKGKARVVFFFLNRGCGCYMVSFPLTKIKRSRRGVSINLSQPRREEKEKVRKKSTQMGKRDSRPIVSHKNKKIKYFEKFELQTLCLCPPAWRVSAWTLPRRLR